jgi:hypothetical protein
MPLINTIANRVLYGGVTRRLARAIPNPVARYVAMTAVSALLPALIAALSKRGAGPAPGAEAEPGPRGRSDTRSSQASRDRHAARSAGPGRPRAR